MKRWRIVIIAAAVVAIAAAAWFFLARGSYRSAGALGVTVRVNLERQLVITPGTPLQIEVSLTSAPSASALSIGGWWRAWHEYVRLEDAATGRSVPWSLEFLSARSSVLESSADGGRVVVTTSRRARLEGGRHVHTATFVAAPEATAQTAAGALRLRAVVQSPRWQVWGWRGRAVSSPVAIAVRARDDGKEGIEALEKQRLKYSAKYYLSVGRAAEARRATDELLARKPDDPAAIILLGDVLVAENQPSRALAEYHRAMARLPRAYEEPVLLLERIRRAAEAAKTETGR